MTKVARLDMRLSPADDLMIRRAAEVSGTSVTAFVLGSARTSAAHVLADRTVFTLDQDQVDELDRRLRAEPRAKRRLTDLASSPERFE